MKGNSKTRLKLYQQSRPKRANYEATVEKLPSGKYRARAMIEGTRITGKAMRTMSEALASYRSKLAEHQAKAGCPDLTTYAYKVLDGPYRERVETGQMSSATWDLYDMIFRTQVENDLLGSLPLDKIGPADIEEWLRALWTQGRPAVVITNSEGKEEVKRAAIPSRPMAPNSKARYAGFLSGLFERARIIDRLIVVNPVHDAEKPGVIPGKFRILTEREESELIGVAREYDAKWHLDEPKLKRRNEVIVLLGLHGLGPAEMCGVRREDFDAEGLDIQRQARRGAALDRLKTDRRKGWIAVSEELLEAIKDLEGFILTGTDRPAQEDNMRRSFKQMVKETPFDGMLPYDLRHTFAMRLLEKGVDIRTVAELMRNTPEVILNTYAKSRKDLKTQAIERLRRSH